EVRLGGHDQRELRYRVLRVELGLAALDVAENSLIRGASVGRQCPEDIRGVRPELRRGRQVLHRDLDASVAILVVHVDLATARRDDRCRTQLEARLPLVVEHGDLAQHVGARDRGTLLLRDGSERKESERDHKSDADRSHKASLSFLLEILENEGRSWNRGGRVVVLAAVGSVAMLMNRGNHCSLGNYFIMDRGGGRATRRETLTRRVG